MSRGLKWFRAEYDRNDKLVSICLADKLTDDGGRIVYVRATNVERAKVVAYKAHQRMKLRERRAGYKARGLCKCGRPRDTDGTACSWCIERRKEHKKRHAARERGEDVPPANWAGTRDARRERERDELRLSILVEIDHAADSMPYGHFKRWVAEQIAKLQRKGRAA